MLDRCRLALAPLAALFLVLCSPPSHAGPIRLGLQGSVGPNSLTGNLPNEGSWEGRFGLGGGIVLEYNPSPNVALGLQPSYAPRDTRQVFDFTTPPTATEYELNYLSIPLVIRVTGSPRGVRGFATAGLDLGLLLDACAASTGSSSRSITEAFNSSTLGALFGAGAMVPLGRHYLSIEVRYLQGLTDIVAREGSGSRTDLDTASESVKYRGLNLLVSFLFTLGGAR